MGAEPPIGPELESKLIQHFRTYRLYVRLRRWMRPVGYALLALAAAAGALWLYCVLAPLPAATIHQTTTLYDKDGQILDQFYNQGINRHIIPLEEIPLVVRQATLAVEDRNFYRHPGIDGKALLRAIWIDLRTMSKAQGGSTITQQLARNLYLTLDKTWKRKLTEALYTLQLEARYSKDQILEMYLNQIYYGSSAYGIEAAAQTYLGKSARELNLAEAALLAGIPKNPAGYSPYHHWERAKERQKKVLQDMVEWGVLTPEEAEAAYETPIRLKERTSDEPRISPYFIDYVLWEAQQFYGLEPQDIMNSGLRIYTSVDPQMNAIAEKHLKEVLAGHHEELQGALVALEPSTGQIRALVGGRDYKQSQFNRVLAMRQPGSSFKPLLYAAALERGWLTTTLVPSQPTTFAYAGGQYTPRNYGDQYAGREITMREAIARSDNIYAVTAHMHLGEEVLVEMARRFGIQSPLSAIPSLALGTKEVRPLELAAVYATLANQGVAHLPHAITRITDAQGRVLFEPPQRERRVLSPEVSFILTNLLQSVFEPGGTGYRVKPLLSRPVAGKTGTTDWDAWLGGYTPQLAAVVWVGYDQNRKLTTSESHTAATIWARFMEEALAEEPAAMFHVPEGVVSAYVDPMTGLLATEECPQVRLEVFMRGTEPKESCHLHHKDRPAEKEPMDNGGWLHHLWKWIHRQ